MKEVGFISTANLHKLAQGGVTPKEAVETLLDEAKRRNPNARAVIMQKREGGFAFVAL